MTKRAKTLRLNKASQLTSKVVEPKYNRARRSRLYKDSKLIKSLINETLIKESNPREVKNQPNEITTKSINIPQLIDMTRQHKEAYEEHRIKKTVEEN